MNWEDSIWGIFSFFAKWVFVFVVYKLSWYLVREAIIRKYNSIIFQKIFAYVACAFFAALIAGMITQNRYHHLKIENFTLIFGIIVIPSFVGASIAFDDEGNISKKVDGSGRV